MSEQHVVTGLTREEYERVLREDGSADGRLSPRMHRHPDLRITHAHGSEDDARAPHTHTWITVVDAQSYVPIETEQ